MEIQSASVTPFQRLKSKVGDGNVSSAIVYFPVKGVSNGLVFRNEDGTIQETVYKLDASDTNNLYGLFVYKLDKNDKKKGGKYSPKVLSDRFDEGYESFANFLNELDKVSKRSFDRNPIILRIANGTFDTGVYNNQIVGALMTYNELSNARLLQMIEDGNIANLITSSILSPDSLDIYFKLKHTTPENMGMQLVGLIQNGTSGLISFNFNAVVKSANGKYKYILPQLDENGGYVKMKGRNRHLGWLENGVAELVEAVEKISTINYYETLAAITFEKVFLLFDRARHILINDKKNPMDAEKSEIVFGTLYTKCKAMKYTTGLQVFDEATLLAEVHGNAKYLNRMLDQVFDIIFGQ